MKKLALFAMLLSMTYSDLKTRVSRRVIDLPPPVVAEVPDLVNDAIRSMQRKYNFRAMEESASFTTAEGVLLLGTIDRFKEYRDDGPYLLRKLIRGRTLLTTVGAIVDKAVLSDVDLPDEPEFIVNTVNKASGVWSFSIAPYPNTFSDWPDGNYRIVVPYYEYSAKLVNDSDTNWFVDNAEDYIIMKATAEAFGLDWDYDSMALWLQRAEEKFKELKKADATNRLSGVNELVPFDGAFQPKVRL